MRSTLERYGLALPRVAGAHLVRHSLATQLVRQRRPIDDTAQIAAMIQRPTLAEPVGPLLAPRRTYGFEYKPGAALLALSGLILEPKLQRLVGMRRGYVL